MSNFFNNLKRRSKEAAHRIAREQIIRAAKFKLLQTLRQRGLGDKNIDAVSNFIDTELGTALLSTSIGLVVPFLPKYKNNKLIKSIAKEYRQGGLVFAADLLANKFANMYSTIQKITKYNSYNSN